MPDVETPDEFMAARTAHDALLAPESPDQFMASRPPRAEDLPSRDVFEASHHAAVAQHFSAWDRIKTAAEAIPAMLGGLINNIGEAGATPIVPESVVPYAQPKTVPQAIVHRTAEFARGLTSPQNLAIGALIGPLGKIAPLLSRGISAGFGVQALKSAYDQSPEIQDAIHKKDWPRAAGAITTAVLSGALGAAAGTHAIRGGRPGVPPKAEPSPVERATESARAGVEALAPETPDQFMARRPAAEPPTVPEKPETIDIQAKQLADGTRKAVMLPSGTPPPAGIPAGAASLETPAGTFLYDPARIAPQEIHNAVTENRLPEILGPAEGGLGAPDKSQIQGEPATVVARSPEGTEVQATVTDQPNLDRTLDQSRKVTPPGGTVAVEHPGDVLAGRVAPKITEEHRDFVGSAGQGENKFSVMAHVGGKLLGAIDYAETTDNPGVPVIEYIAVSPSARRTGVATSMVKHLADKYGYDKIDWGYLTDEGAKLKDSTDKLFAAPAPQTPDEFMAQQGARGTDLATGREQPVILQDFVSGRGGFASPARMIVRSMRDVAPDEIRRAFFPDLGPDKLDIQKLRPDDFMGAAQPGRQPFRLQFMEDGRHVSAPEGIEERLGLKTGENYHRPLPPDATQQGAARQSAIGYEYRDTPDGIFVEARQGGKVVGGATFNRSGNTLKVQQLNVDASLRRQGIASALYDIAAEKHKAETGVDPEFTTGSFQTESGKAFRSAYDARRAGGQPAETAEAQPQSGTTLPGVVSAPRVPPTPPTDTEGQPGPLPAATLGSGLGAFEPFFRESIAEGNALLVKRRAAVEAMKAREGTPEQKSAGQALRQWFTGERDWWSTRVNQAVDRVSRLFTPDVQTREAVGMMREFAHRPGELDQFLDGTHPALAQADPATLKRIEALRPAMRQALAPTAKMLRANQVYTNIADQSLKEGQAGGWLGSRWTPDEYMPHLLHAAGEGEVAAAPQDSVRLLGNIGKRFQFAERRSDEYPTMLHAIADGKIPKTMDPADAFAIHGSAFARARATHLFEEQMGAGGMGHWGTSETAPVGWRPLAQHTDEFSRSVQVQDEGGETSLANQRLYVPPFIQEALRPLTAPDVTGHPFRAVRGAQRSLKEAILGLSAFHLLTENVMAPPDIGLGGVYKAFATSRDSRGFLEWERDGALHGMPTSIQGRTMEAYRNQQPGSIPTRGEIIRAYIPGAKQTLELANHITNFTFNNVQRRFKVTSYMLHSMAWDDQNPGGTEAQRSVARQGIASYVNGVYGGLHWENLGWTKAMVETARLILLAPDWSGSNVALAKYAVGAKPSLQEIPFRDKLAGATDKPTVEARLSRAFWAKSLTGGLIGTQLLSLMFSGQYSKKPFMVYMGKDKNGEDVHQNLLFRGSSGDLVNLASRMEDHGMLVGAGEFLGGKAAPFTRAGVHLITGQDEFGREIAPKGLNPIANTARAAGKLISDVLPVPIALRSLQRTSFADDADKYSWSERVLSTFGPPPQHRPPEGMKRSGGGFAPIPFQSENSIWNQILTGRQFPSRRERRGLQ